MSALGNSPKLRMSATIREAAVRKAAVTRNPREKAIQMGSKGRKKGKGAKADVAFNLKGVLAELEAQGYNPMQEVIKALREGKLDDKTKLAAGLSLIEYIHPKLKSVEMKQTIKHDPAELQAQLTRLLEKAKK